jgi:hypothetical protein
MDKTTTTITTMDLGGESEPTKKGFLKRIK